MSSVDAFRASGDVHAARAFADDWKKWLPYSGEQFRSNHMDFVGFLDAWLEEQIRNAELRRDERLSRLQASSALYALTDIVGRLRPLLERLPKEIVDEIAEVVTGLLRIPVVAEWVRSVGDSIRSTTLRRLREVLYEWLERLPERIDGVADDPKRLVEMVLPEATPPDPRWDDLKNNPEALRTYVEKCGTQKEAARRLGKSEKTLQRKLKRSSKEPGGPEMDSETPLEGIRDEASS